MNRIPPDLDETQTRCFAILKSYWQGDLRGPISLEDQCRYWIRVSPGIDREGEEILRLYLRPELSKTPVSRCHLELVIVRSGRTKRPPDFVAVLHRTSPKIYDWQSDFSGTLALPDQRRYLVGISIATDRTGEQILRVHFCPAHLYKTPRRDARRLGVAK
jgi:hypothetical protein